MAALKFKAKTGHRRIVIATHNPGKLREMETLLAPLRFKILSLKDFPEIPPVVEDGATFDENAEKKAKTVADITGLPAVADDSGLMVEALGGRPGVFSSRFAGEKTTDRQKCERLLQEMAGIPEGQRKAAFVCALAIALPKGKVKIVEEKCRGRISFAPRGGYGFGYDPIFFLPECGKTMAELEPEVKNQISHRGRAMNKLKLILPQFLA
jgi:XTP/dITP diphosphohydrolase